MGASAGDFLDHLEQAGLLDPDSLKPLWKQVARAPDLSAEKLAASLVESGQLTGFQAKNALKALGLTPGAEGAAEKAPSAPEKTVPPASVTPPAPTVPSAPKTAALPSEAGTSPSDRTAALAAKYLARGGSAAPTPTPAAPKAPVSDDLELDLAPLDDEPKRAHGAKPTAAPKQPAAVPTPPRTVPTANPVVTPQKAAPAKTPQKTAPAAAPQKPSAPTGPAAPQKSATSPAQPSAPANAPEKPAAAGATQPAAPAKAPQKAAPLKTAAPITAANADQKAAPAQPAAKKNPAAKPASAVEELPTLEPIAELEPLASVDDLASLEGLTGVPDELTPLLTGNAQLVDAPPVSAAPLDLAALEVDPLSTAGPTTAFMLAKQKRGPWWKSPARLGGAAGGLLVALLITWVVLRWLRGTPETLMATADELYASQTYGDAAHRYASFVWRFPSDERIGHARVRRGLAQMHAAQEENAGDWAHVLQVAQDELPEMAEAAEFSEAHEELAKLLPQVAAGLVEQAKAASSDPAAQQELVTQAEAAVALLDDSAYWPDAWRRGIALERDTIAESLDDMKRDATRERDFSTALEKMQAALKAGNMTELYAARQALVRAHPALAAHGLLRELLTSAAKTLREQAKANAEPLPALAPAAKPLATVVLSARFGGAAKVEASARVFVNVAGAVYALEGASGRVLWRHEAGPDSPPPVSLAKAGGGADALVWHAGTHELVRCAGDDGHELWRAAFGEACGAPLAAGERVYVAGRSGKVWALAGATGKLSASIALPQELALAPAVDAKSSRVFQLAEHSNLYVLAADLATCESAVYLGQGAGSVAVPPVVVQGYAFIAENIGADRCQLHIVTGNETTSFKEAQPPIPLIGRVLTPPVALAQGIAVATDRGAVYVLHVDSTSEVEPVKIAAQAAAEGKLSPLPFLGGEEGQLWVADQGLTRYGILPQKDQLQRRWFKFDTDLFLAAPQRMGGALITVRARAGTSGASVAALRVDAAGAAASDAETIWETGVGVAAAGPLVTNAGQPPLFAVTADGNILPIDKTAFDQGRAEVVLEKPAAQPMLLEPGAPLANGWAWRDAAAGNQANTFDLQAVKDGLHSWELGVGDAVGGNFTAFGVGVLVPCATGRLELRNPATGAPLALPFQPRLEPGVKVTWAQAAATGSDGKEFVVADSRRKIYRVGLETEPQPFLKQLAVADIAGTPCGAVVVLGSTALVATRGASADQLTPFALADLKPGAAVTLAGRIAAGPVRVGEAAVVGLESGNLIWYTVAGGGELKETKAAEPVGMLAGQPAAIGQGEMLVAAADGFVRRFSLASGELTGKLDLGTPLGSGPVVLGTRMFVFGRDGTLHFGALPGK